MSELLDYDPLTGIERWLHYDHLTDSVIVEQKADVEPLMDHNKRVLLEADHRKQMKEDWIHYAKVHPLIIYNWKKDYGVDFFNRDHWPKVMALINSRDYRDACKVSTIHHDR